MNGTLDLVRIHDLDLMLREMESRVALSKLKRLGLSVGSVAPIEHARHELLERLVPRWHNHYERARRRYGTAVAPVRARVCQGCHMTLPRSAAPPAEDPLTVCQSCGRILFWA